MADEQTILLSPEEDVTSVHERLEQTPARRILLVVPPQTHLRSLTSWRVLRSYARELDKEVLVVTSDRQIRSVAKEAQFRVANSLESPPSSKGRSGSNPSRSGIGRITSLRGPSDRGGRSVQRTRQPQGPAHNPRTGPGTPAPQNTPRSPLPPSQPPGELHPFPSDEMEENTDLGQPSSSFGGPEEPEEPYGSPFDFRVPPSSLIHPVEAEPEQEDEDLDSFHYNYQQSQKILQAAQQQKDEAESETEPREVEDTDRMVAPHDHMVAPSDDEQIGGRTNATGGERAQWLSAPGEPVDPFAEMDDFQPLPLSEQRGAAMMPIHDFDDGEEVADISHYPTADIQAHGDIEDLGDVGMDELPPLEEPLEPPSYDYRSRMRSGSLSPRSIGADTEEEEDETEAGEELPAIEEQPTRVIPPALGLPDAVTGSNSRRVFPANPPTGNRAVPTGPMSRQREPEVVALPPATRRSTPLSTPPTSRRPAPTSVPKPKRPTPTSTQRPRQPVSRSQRKREINWITPVVIIVAFLLIGIIIFLIPSADVTVALAAKSYSWPVVVTASSTSKQDVTLRTVPVRTANFTKTITKTGRASGTNTTVGTASATGIVQFTNNGSQPVTLRSGTLVSTTNNVLFATSAEAVVPQNGNQNGNTIVVPVQAQTPGVSGNVAAGSITVIPAITISQISQDSNGATVKLSVTNPNPTTGGGGSGTATTVTTKDVNTLQSSINTQLQTELQAWITQQEQQQNSLLANPLQQNSLSKVETVTATPAAGKVASNGTFSETVNVNLPVQFVRKSDLQAQANAQYTQLSSESKLPKGVTKPPEGYALIQGQPVQLKPTACNSGSKTSTANASTLCFTATSPIALPISAQQVQNLVIGKQVQIVKESLPNSKNGLAGIKSVAVKVFPGFWPWMPFWTQRISVHFTAAT